MNWPSSKRKKRKLDPIQSNYDGSHLHSLIHDEKSDDNDGNTQSNACIHQIARRKKKEDFDINNVMNMNDTQLAIESLKQRNLCFNLSNGPCGGVSSRIVLRHMLDDVLDLGRDSARSTIERELSSLCSSSRNLFRKIHLLIDNSIFGNTVGIISTKEYLIEAKNALTMLVRDDDMTNAVNIFESILSRFCSLSVSHEDLIQHIKEHMYNLKKDRNYKEKGTAAGAENLIENFLSAKLLMQRRDKKGLMMLSYWFAVPGIGQFVTYLTEGRSEIVLQIKRSRYKEIKRDSVERSSMRKSNLGGEFHVRDLLSRNLIVVKKTACGEFLRLSS